MLDQLGLAHPIIQAPMAGVSTPAMAVAVSEAGALGSIGIGATDASGARKMMLEVRSRTERPVNVNVFVHRSPGVAANEKQLGFPRLRRRLQPSKPPRLRSST